MAAFVRRAKPVRREKFILVFTVLRTRKYDTVWKNIVQMNEIPKVLRISGHSWSRRHSFACAGDIAAGLNLNLKRRNSMNTHAALFNEQNQETFFKPEVAEAGADFENQSYVDDIFFMCQDWTQSYPNASNDLTLFKVIPDPNRVVKCELPAPPPASFQRKNKSTERNTVAKK